MTERLMVDGRCVHVTESSGLSDRACGGQRSIGECQGGGKT